jgi:aminoglycoside 6-adenylyltransferase
MKSRDEKQMLELIVGTAREDANIRTVVLEGSRANPLAVKDPLQDYDVIYGVTTVKPYSGNMEWIKRFGDLMILQMPDGMGNSPLLDHKFTYLMQFVDGNRIDLNVYDVAHLKNHRFSSQSMVLLDKDDWLKLPPLSSSDYFPGQPTRKQFDDCCNEYWWVATYVAKGLWRGDLPYARHMLDNIVRCQALKMMDWYFGIKTNFRESPGKYGKRFRTYIESELCDRLAATYSTSDIESTWQALDTLCALFRDVSSKVGARFGYLYCSEDDRRVTLYLQHLRTLPRESTRIY